MTIPKIGMKIELNPLSVLRSDSEYMVTAKLDIITPGEQDGAIARPLNLSLVIDKSGSMQGEKIETAKATAIRIVEKLSDQDFFSMVAFNDTSEVLVSATMIKNQRQSICQKIGGLKASSSTRLILGFQSGLEQIHSNMQKKNVVNVIFVITDGQTEDRPECIQIGAETVKDGIFIYSAGIGTDYDLDFLDQFCGKDNVDHIDQPTQMQVLFDRFLEREGKSLTSNCYLYIIPAEGVKLYSIQAQENAEKLALDQDNRIAIKNLFIGKHKQYKIEFVLQPQSSGIKQLADFLLKYDMPGANLSNEEVKLDATIEVTEDTQKAGISNPQVVKLVRRMMATQKCQNAEIDVQKNNIRGATEKLEQASRMLQQSGELEKAKEVTKVLEAYKKIIDQANPNPEDVELERKRLRGTTKLLSLE